MYFNLNSKLLPGKHIQKVNKQKNHCKNSEFVLVVRKFIKSHKQITLYSFLQKTYGLVSFNYYFLISLPSEIMPSLTLYHTFNSTLDLQGTGSKRCFRRDSLNILRIRFKKIKLCESLTV